MTNDLPEDDLFYVNGINGSTGDYGLAPMSDAELVEAIMDEAIPDNIDELEQRNRDSTLMLQILKERLVDLKKLRENAQGTEADKLNRQITFLEKDIADREKGHLGVKEGVDPDKLNEAGWGIIFADGDGNTAAIKEAMSSLLSLREQQAGDYFKVFEGSDGYRPNDTYLKFLARHGVGPGPVDPDKGVPYYLLIVGSPATIPYNFQYQLDVQFAVGRIYFDTVNGYAQYTNNVVATETGQVKLSKQGCFFGVANQQDKATKMSNQHLIQPLHERFSQKYPNWQFDLWAEKTATKAQLSQLLNGDNAPALLFAASHGMAFDKDDPRQMSHQGALLCQDWPGPRRWRKPIPEDHYFAADDLESKANLLGLMAFSFACYGAGTPQFDEFSELRNLRTPIAAAPFIANLPKRLLQQGALAVVGHVERAWGYSFFWPGAGTQLAVFESTLERLLNGSPIGSAVEYFNERYAELATILVETLDNAEAGSSLARKDLPGLWTANNDARNYVIIGDPAARLPVVRGDEAPLERSPMAKIDITSDIISTSVEAETKKPPTGISADDWAATPESVKTLLQKYFGQYGSM